MSQSLDPPTTVICFQSLESNVQRHPPSSDHHQPESSSSSGITTWTQWLATGVWCPFLLSLVLFLLFAQIFPHISTPHLGFLFKYNPQHRDDVSLGPSTSSIDFGVMCAGFSVVWCVLAWFIEVGFDGSHAVFSSSRFYRWLTLSLAYGETLMLTNATTDFIKFRVGALRPDFFHRCFGDLDLNTTTLPSTLVHGLDSCPRFLMHREDVLEGLVSFPSGHTSVAMSCGLFLTYYFLWCLYGVHVHKQTSMKLEDQTQTRYRKWVNMMMHQGAFSLALLPTLLGLSVAMSRLTDFRHHFQDVLMGMLLGLFFATVVFGRTIQCLK